MYIPNRSKIQRNLSKYAGETKVILCHEMPKMAKWLPYNLHG